MIGNYNILKAKYDELKTTLETDELILNELNREEITYSYTPYTFVRIRTFDNLFTPVEVKTILSNWDSTITYLKAQEDNNAKAMGELLERTKTYMSGTSDADGIDVGDEKVRNTVLSMVPTILTETQAIAINDVAKVEDKRTVAQRLVGWGILVSQGDLDFVKNIGKVVEIPTPPTPPVI